MSFVYLYAIPTDPRWVPDAAQEAAAVAVFDQLVPRHGSDAIETRHESRVSFYDAGECFENVRCPACDELIAQNPADMGWFVEQINGRWSDDAGYWPLHTTTPCCGAATSLNDLTYTAPQGFASWSMRAFNAEPVELAEWEREELERALGHPVRLVYTLY